MEQKLSLPPRLVKNKIRQLVAAALKNINYATHARLIERYRLIYELDDKLLYALGLLYDHAGLKTLGLILNNVDKSWLTATIRQRARAQKYFARAQAIFNQLLTKNAHTAQALFRLGVIEEVQGNFEKSLYFKKKAYRLMKANKAPKTPLLIGFTYFKMSDKKMAERWFKKDLLFYGPDDPAANLNIFLFYFLSGNYRKAFPYVSKIKKILSQAKASFGRRALKLWWSRLKKVQDRVKNNQTGRLKR